MANYSAQEIANFFLFYGAKKGDLTSNKKLQKLLYYAQAWHLVFNNKPLFDEKIEAWIHGSVIPSLYRKYKKYKWEPIPPPNTKSALDKKTEQFLTEVYSVYGDHSAEYLERLIHSEEPWIEARGNKSIEEYSNTPISQSTMKSFYSRLLKSNGKKRKNSTHHS